jgi:hypothetical protein
VIAAVSVGGRRMFVGSRAHHVDVGGSTPGSMPPRAASLAEEGFVVRHLPLLVDGRVRPDLVAHLVGCRQPATVIADLEAQIAANASMAAGLTALGPGDAVARWGAALADAADAAVRDVVAALPDGARAEDTLDGIPLAVTLRRAGDGLVVDFAGTGGPHPGNLNAPRAVVRAAVLYALRGLAILVYWWAPKTELTLFVFAATMGLMWLGTVPLTSGVLARRFGVADLGTLFGLAFVSHQLGGFLGAWLGGLGFAFTGNYDAVFLATAAAGLAGLTEPPSSEVALVVPVVQAAAPELAAPDWSVLAPEVVPAGKPAARAETMSSPSFSTPCTLETMCIT